MTMRRIEEARTLISEAGTMARCATKMSAPQSIGAALADACTNLARAINIILEHIEAPNQEHDR